MGNSSEELELPIGVSWPIKYLTHNFLHFLGKVQAFSLVK